MEDLAALPAALLEVKPTMLYSVPTLFKRCVRPPSLSPFLPPSFPHSYTERAPCPSAVGLSQPPQGTNPPSLPPYVSVYDKIQDKIRNEKPFTKALIGRALSVAEERRMLLQEGESPGAFLSLQYKVLDKIGT